MTTPSGRGARHPQAGIRSLTAVERAVPVHAALRPAGLPSDDADCWRLVLRDLEARVLAAP